MVKGTPTVTNSITVTYIFVVVAGVAVVHVVGGTYNLQPPSKSTKKTDLISTNPLLTSEGFAHAHSEMTNSKMTCINQTWQVFVDPARVFKVINESVLNKPVLHLSHLPWIFAIKNLFKTLKRSKRSSKCKAYLLTTCFFPCSNKTHLNPHQPSASNEKQRKNNTGKTGPP